MLLYLLQRLGVLAATLVAASLIVFAVMDILPGNAAETILGPTATPEAVAALTHKLGLDQPLYLRYAHWIGGAVHGDFGLSYAYGSPISRSSPQVSRSARRSRSWRWRSRPPSHSPPASTRPNGAAEPATPS